MCEAHGKSIYNSQQDGVKQMFEDGRIVPTSKRPTKPKKPEDVFSPSAMTTEEKKEQAERMAQGQVKLGLFIIAGHLQRFIENRSLQTVLEEHDLLVSWDDQKKKVVVVTCPRPPSKSKKGVDSTARGNHRTPAA